MKRFRWSIGCLVVVGVLLCLTYVASAGDFIPRSFSTVFVTKSTSVSTVSLRELAYNCTAATTLQLNGTGSTFPAAANTTATIKIAPNVRSITFAHASSAGSYCYTQRH